MSQNEIMLKVKKILVWTMWGLAVGMFLGLLIKATPSGYISKNAFTCKLSNYYGMVVSSTTGKAVTVLIMIIATSALLWFKQSYLTLASHITAMIAFILSLSINGQIKGLCGKVGAGVVFLTIFAVFYYIAALGLLVLTVYRLVRIGQRTHKFEIYPYEVVLEDVVRAPQGPAPTSGYAQQPYAQPTQQPYAQPMQQPYAQPMQQPYAQPVQQPYAQPTQQPYAQPTQPVQQPVSAPQETKFCTSCGAPNAAGARFCGKCGNPFA